MLDRSWQPGPLWAAFGATLVAGAAGAVGGGVIGYLVDQGVPQDIAHVYETAVNRGDILVAVRSSHLSSTDAVSTLEKYGATEVGRHAVGTFSDGALEPSVVDLTVSEREQALETPGSIPVVTPVTPTMPSLTSPVVR